MRFKRMKLMNIYLQLQVAGAGHPVIEAQDEDTGDQSSDHQWRGPSSTPSVSQPTHGCLKIQHSALCTLSFHSATVCVKGQHTPSNMPNPDNISDIVATMDRLLLCNTASQN